MRLYWAIVDNTDRAQLTNHTETEVRAVCIELAKTHPKYAPFEAVCLADLGAVARKLKHMANDVPETVKPSLALRSAAFVFEELAKDSEAYLGFAAEPPEPS